MTTQTTPVDIPAQSIPTQSIPNQLIPTRLHQIFISNDKISKLPRQWKLYTKKAIALHPTWEYICWDKKMLYDFIEKHHQTFMPYFTDSVPVVIQADIGRYLILKHYGGWYFDFDFEMIQALDEWNTYTIILPRERESDETKHGAFQIGNAILGAKAHHWFWDMILDALPPVASFPLDISHEGIMETTGPSKITQLYLGLDGATQASITCPKRTCFHTPVPHHLSSQEYKTLLAMPDVYGFHHTHSSWRDDDILKNIRRRKYLLHPLIRPIFQKWGQYLEKKRCEGKSS